MPESVEQADSLLLIARVEDRQSQHELTGSCHEDGNIKAMPQRGEEERGSREKNATFLSKHE